MPFRYTVLFCLLLSMFGCHDQAQENKEKLLEKRWVLTDANKEYWVRHIDARQGWHFHADSIEFLHGIYSAPNFEANRSDTLDEYTFLGLKTAYYLEGDSLFYYQKDSLFWKRAHIHFPDSLSFLLRYSDGKYEKYELFDYQNRSLEEFDLIVFGTYGGHGGSPSFFSIFNQQGEYWIQLDRHIYDPFSFFRTTYKAQNMQYSSLYKGNIPKEKLNEIFQKYSDANLLSYQDYYEQRGSGDIAYNTVAVKNNHLFKSIVDYGREMWAKHLLEWAYVQPFYLFQTIPLTPIADDACHGFPTLDIRAFIKDGTRYEMHYSLVFLLKYYLMKGKLTDSSFEKQYAVQFWGGKDFGFSEEAYTDGRFFQFEKNGKAFIIDIGFNFIKNFSSMIEESKAIPDEVYSDDNEIDLDMDLR